MNITLVISYNEDKTRALQSFRQKYKAGWFVVEDFKPAKCRNSRDIGLLLGGSRKERFPVNARRSKVVEKRNALVDTEHTEVGYCVGMLHQPDVDSDDEAHIESL
jgi:hypothetical protein